MTKVSVVMSVFNQERYLSTAIDSILNQSYTDFEFIIVNDGSTDSSNEIILGYKDKRIGLIQQENSGLPAALNMAISKAKGDFIARLDADDIAHQLKQSCHFAYHVDRFQMNVKNTKISLFFFSSRMGKFFDKVLMKKLCYLAKKE